MSKTVQYLDHMYGDEINSEEVTATINSDMVEIALGSESISTGVLRLSADDLIELGKLVAYVTD